MKSFSIGLILSFIRFITNSCPLCLKLVMWKIKIILKYVVRYRNQVVTSNLQNSFGDRYTKAQIALIKSRYYDVLVRYIQETFQIISFDRKKITKRVRIAQKENWETYFAGQNSVIIAASHYGNWEMNMVVFPALTARRVVAFYKPISDPMLDAYMKKIRSVHGLELYAIEQTGRIMAALKGEKVLYIFIGDQSPLNMNGVYWNTFLEQDTPWLNGAEKLARKFNYPVVYLQQVPEHRSPFSYTLRFQIISSNPQEEAPGLITEKYSRILEEEILDKPEYWLWSHKRWKRAHLKPGL